MSGGTAASERVAGALIGESLRNGADLDQLALQVDRIWRCDAGDGAAGQPVTWTFLLFFSAPAAAAMSLATALSLALDRGGWYCDFRSSDETFVVFAGRIFRYQRGDRVHRAEVESYARSLGVPEAQLDWSE